VEEARGTGVGHAVMLAYGKRVRDRGDNER